MSCAPNQPGTDEIETGADGPPACDRTLAGPTGAGSAPSSSPSPGSPSFGPSGSSANGVSSIEKS